MEALQILMDREAKRKRVADEKTRDVDIGNKAPHLLTTLGDSGSSIRNGLRIADLKALLTHNDPEGGEPKGNKAELLARVKMRNSVKAALMTYELDKTPSPNPPIEPQNI